MDNLSPIGKYKWLFSRTETSTSDYFDIREYQKENFASGVWWIVEKNKDKECQILIFTLGDYMWINVNKSDLIPLS